MMLFYFFVLLLSRVNAEEVTTPSNLLAPRNFNHHPFDAEQFLKSLKPVKPTKQGPVLFPNDAPPSPRTPLIVTSRPLLESIARSDLNPNPVNNTATAQSLNRVSFVPYLAKVKEYRPYDLPTKFDYEFRSTPLPYADVNGVGSLGRSYDNFEKQTVLPPIYKTLSDYANKKILIQPKPNNYDYTENEPDYSQQYQNNGDNDDKSNTENGQNYAFSYEVKDHKTGDDFSHSQQSSGSATNGEYRVRLPDGRMQIVSYTADENGYKADVRYDDEEKRDNSIDTQYNHNFNHYNNYADRNNQHNNYADKNNQHNNYVDRNNYRNNIVKTPNDYIDKLHINYGEHKDFKPVSEKYNNAPEKADYYNSYSDTSKEYFNDDYSSEYNGNYQPYKSKFSSFVDDKKISNDFNNNQITGSTVTPSYEELKDLFVTKSWYNTNHFNKNSVQVIPSSTPSTYVDGTTEHVVVIAPKPNLYTNIRNSYSVTGTPVPVYTPSEGIITSSPRSYLASTISSLKNKIHLGAKPILSDQFIERINKYINFK